VHNKLVASNGRLQVLATSDRPAGELVDELYLSALSRFPNAGERDVAVAHFKAANDRRTALEDLTWALINSKEFLFQH
jgi:hypothetical protein